MKYTKRGEQIITKVLSQTSGHKVKLVGNNKVTFTKSKTGSVYQIMVSTAVDDYGGKKHFRKTDKWKHYSQWASILDGHASPARVAEEMLKHLTSVGGRLWRGPKLSEREARAANSMLAALLVSEPYRRDGAAKFARAALRAVALNGYTFAEVFGGPDPMFTLAASKGCNNWDVITDNKNELPTDNQMSLIECLSSSESESESDSDSESGSSSGSKDEVM